MYFSCIIRYPVSPYNNTRANKMPHHEKGSRWWGILNVDQSTLYWADAVPLLRLNRSSLPGLSRSQNISIQFCLPLLFRYGASLCAGTCRRGRALIQSLAEVGIVNTGIRIPTVQPVGGVVSRYFEFSVNSSLILKALVRFPSSTQKCGPVKQPYCSGLLRST